jgi:thiol:disulfide interchange protein
MMGDAAKQRYDSASADESKTVYVKPAAAEYFKNFPALVEFYSEDCPICRRMAPLMEGIKSQCHGNMVDVLQIDVTKPENKHFVKKFRLLGMPTFVFFDKKGEEAARLIGEQTEQTIKQALSALRGSPCPGVTLMQSGYLEQIDGSAGAACGGGEDAKPNEDCGSGGAN